MKKIRGLDKVQSELHKKIQEIEGQTLKGLIKAQILIRDDMDKTPPLIPVQTGNLRSSYFSNPIPNRLRPAIILGFTAFYAWYVHEMVGATFKRPGAGAKFFEAALKRNEDKILQIIKEHAKIK